MADNEEVSLREQLENAFTTDANAGEEGIENKEDETEISSGSEMHEDKNNSLGAQEEKSNVDEDDGVKDEKEEEQSETLQAPDHWSAADKETFAKSPRDVQEWALRRHQQMESDYQRKTTDLANFRKTWEPLNEMFAPYIQQGVSPASVIQGWAQVAQNLQQNPTQALQELARQYNIDMSSLTHPKKDDIWGDEKKVEDPRVSQLQQQLQAVAGHLQQRDQLEQQSKINTFQSQIEQFAQKKTEAGDLAHPHFDELLPDMMLMARAQRQAGQEPDLNNLYNSALWANPVTREKTLEAQRIAAQKKAENEAIAKARKAKHASKSIGNSSGTANLNRDMSLREMIESQF